MNLLYGGKCFCSYQIVVGLTVSQAFAFIMLMAQEWFLTLGTHKMLQNTCTHTQRGKDNSKSNKETNTK